MARVLRNASPAARKHHEHRARHRRGVTGFAIAWIVDAATGDDGGDNAVRVGPHGATIRF